MQVLPAGEGRLDIEELAERLSGLGEVSLRRFYLEFDDGQLRFSIFPDGRTLVKGTDDPARAPGCSCPLPWWLKIFIWWLEQPKCPALFRK